MKKLKGFTFIEILMSLMLLSLLLIAIDASQITSLRESKKSYYLATAFNQLHTLATQLSTGFNNEFIATWKSQNALLLPNGRGECSGTYPNYHIVVSWGDATLANCEHIQLSDESGCISETIKLEA